MMLEHAWIGTTEFKEIGKPIDIEANHEYSNTNHSKLADLASEEEFEEVDEKRERERERQRKDYHTNPTASTHRPLWSFPARDPQR